MPSKSSSTSPHQRPLERQIALVTGASRGIGRGIALQLGQAGATVYITGRAPAASYSTENPGFPSLEQTAKEIAECGGKVHAVYCDHANMDDVRALFKRIEGETGGRLDILVNNAFAGGPAILANAGKKFWECDPQYWDDINQVALRNAYVCATLAARLMVPRGNGLIVNISSVGGLQYMLSVPYGVGKAAADRMAADMGHELKPHNVTCVSLWPGLVQTESLGLDRNADTIAKAAGRPKAEIKQILDQGESPEFVGKAVVALAADPKRIHKTGKILLTVDLAKEYGFTDQKGVVPFNMRSLHFLLEHSGWTGVAKLLPAFINVPKFLLHFASNKF